MRTTVRLDDELLAAAKRLAAASNRTLTAVIEDALRETLMRQAHAPDIRPVTLPVSGGEGVLPGIDLGDWATIKDVLDDPSR